MAKGKYEYWLTDDGLTLLKGWARDGLTDEQIADKMGIGTTTLYRWENEHREIREALKETKEICDDKVENALYKAALEGNTTAMIFWLKNRRRKDWKDHPDDEVNEALLSKAIEVLGQSDTAIDRM